MGVLVPLRYPVAPAADDPVESLACRQHWRAPRSCDHSLDQRVDDRIGYAAHVLRSLHGGRPRGKKRPQRITRYAGEAEALHNDIEIEIVHAVAVLHRVDNSHTGLNAQDPEILDEGVVMRQRNGIIDEEFEGEYFTLWRHALAVPDDVSRLLQERARLAQQGAVLARSIGYRRHIGLPEHFVSDLAAKRFEQGDFGGSRSAHRHHVGILKNGLGSSIGPRFDRRVDPFETQ